MRTLIALIRVANPDEIVPEWAGWLIGGCSALIVGLYVYFRHKQK